MVSVNGEQSVFIHHQYHSLLIIKMGVAPIVKWREGVGSGATTVAKLRYRKTICSVFGLRWRAPI